MYGSVKDYDEYFVEAGEHFGIPPLLLKKIATIESDLDANCIFRNKNGTIDYGIMQINSCHFKELSKYGISKTNIMHPRINIFAGAAILARHIKNEGFNIEAISHYHSRTPKYKEKWSAKLISELNKEFYGNKKGKKY
jgi:soluble lytic murein transglycosylase-like protein